MYWNREGYENRSSTLAKLAMTTWESQRLRFLQNEQILLAVVHLTAE
jgi:hypothetical protein